MSKAHSTVPSDENKTREQLIQELTALRASLAAEKQHSLELSQELDQRVKKACGTRQPQSLELHLSGQPGTAIQGFQYEAVRDERGEIRRVPGITTDITGLARVEQELHKSEDTSRKRLAEIESIYSNAPVGLCVLDTDLRYLRINERLAEINGQPAEAHLGRTVREVVPDIADQAEPAMRRVLETGEPVYRIEISGETAAQPGVLRTWVESWLPMREADGTVIGLNVVALEITDRKRAEEALRVSEQRWAVTLGSIGDAVIATDTGGRVTFLNAVAETLTGWHAAEAVGKPVQEVFRIVNEHTRAEVENPVLKVLSTGNIVGLANHTVLLRRDGGEVPIDDSGAPIRSGDGRVLGVVLVFRDVGERRQAEERLRRSEHRYRNLFQSMEAFSLLEPIPDETGRPSDFRYLEVNAANSCLYGLTPEQMQGRTVLELFREIDPFWIDAYGQVSLTGEPVHLERFGRVTGRWYRMHAYRTEEGNVAVLLIDITERKQAEQALHELTRNLEQRVAERTALAEARSRQLRALAVQLIETEERERRRIAELLHDDLQQLLASARLQLQVACRNLPTAPALAGVESLLKESIDKSRRLAHELSPAVLQHSGLVSALEWLTRQMGEQFGLQVDLEVDASQPPESAALKVFLFRAVQELLFNAVKHAGVDHARVALAVSGDCLAVAVSDEGRGFDPCILDSSTGGAGLGLLSLRERACSIGGKLTIESGPGRGSRFTLTVPLSAAEVEGSARNEPSPEQPSHAEGGGGRTACTGGIRVIFADDHAVMRQGLISMIAGQPDIRVVGEAANGREALEMACRLHPDVVVMDVSMPEMDGLEATRRIKKECPEVRVIGLSMYVDEQIARSMRRAGADAFVSKTATSGELLKAIYGMEDTPD